MLNMASPDGHHDEGSFHPRVIACGHRRVRTKTDNFFPAFLVREPAMLDTKISAEGSTADDQNDADACGGGGHGVSYRYHWRTKRDFLLVCTRLSRM